MRKLLVGSTLLCACVGAFAMGAAPNVKQDVRLDQELHIPGDVLQPGNYTFSVEDTMRDRAVVRIENGDNSKHYLLLTVPNAKLSGQAQNGLILFQSTDEKKQVLKGWACPGCAESLEFVYPKLEAVKITGDSGESVLAVDPESDKLPVNLSADDMKIVTLWLLSPKRVTAEHRGEGLTAQKYESESRKGVEAPGQAQPAQLTARSTTDRSERLPKTASNTFALALWGVLALMAAAGVRASRLTKAE